MIEIPPQYYSLNFPIYAWAIACASLVLIILFCLLRFNQFRAITKKVKADDATPLPDNGYPEASVIIYANATASNLRELLISILNQDYPSPMEVIVVNDRNEQSSVETIVGELEFDHPNLYLTYTPEQSRNLSRKKLSITLGIKAARYDALLFTEANCRIDSPLWMQSMLRHMTPSEGSKQIVIGYATAPKSETNGKCRRIRAYDYVSDSVRNLYAAIKNKATVADGRNLAYNRNLFFQHKGFSRTLNLRNGHDDIFISEISTPQNTAVELSHNSRVDSLTPDEHIAHRQNQLQRMFTARFLRRKPYLRQSFISCLWWLWPISLIAMAIAMLPSLIGVVAAVIIALTIIFIDAAIFRKCSKSLGSRKLFLTVAPLALTRPLRQLRRRWQSHRNRNKNFTLGL